MHRQRGRSSPGCQEGFYHDHRLLEVGREGGREGREEKREGERGESEREE